jgi:HEAT repeat protein
MLRQMNLLKRIGHARARLFQAGLVAVLAAASGSGQDIARYSIGGQSIEQWTPMQREIQRQAQRLKSGEIEDRRDALMRLGNFRRADASRIAAAGLTDLAPIVRVSAAHAVQSLPPAEAAGLLIPLLQDKIEFVRRETAYALGETRSHSAAAPLGQVVLNDTEPGVRAAAAVALGEIGDDSAVAPLSQALTQQPRNQKKTTVEENEFVMRAAAHSLGQIKSRTAVNILIATLTNESVAVDVRREAATALGLIGDPAAVAALQAAFTSTDPYLSDAARGALRRLRAANK